MRVRPAFVIALAVAALCGCNRGPQIATYPVTGTVTYQGKPVEGASVTYLSENPDAPRASATTDSGGHFSLATYAGPTKVLRGAPPGDYNVVIVKQAVSDQQAARVDMSNMSNEERAAIMMKQMQGQLPTQGGQGAASGTPPKPKSEIPERYGRTDTSPLRQTVLSGDNGPVEFTLTDQ